MKKYLNKMGIVAALSASCLLTSTAISAASISFGADQVIDPAAQSVLNIDLIGYGLEGVTLGGDLVINYNSSVVDLTNVTFGSYWNFSQTSAAGVGTITLEAAAFQLGELNTANELIATLDFSILGSGSADLMLSTGVQSWRFTPVVALASGATTLAGTDTFYCTTAASTSALCAADPYPLYLESTNVTVLSAVPVPAAVWLFVSGLAGLVGVSRRKAA